LSVPHLSQASINNSKISSYKGLREESKSYIELDVLCINPSDDFDDLLESKLFLNVVLVVESANPGKNPANMHVDFIVKFVKLLLDTSFPILNLAG
jgi:hypothetical protein